MHVPALGLRVASLLAIPLIGGDSMRTTEQTVEGVLMLLNKRETSTVSSGLNTSFSDEDMEVLLIMTTAHPSL